MLWASRSRTLLTCSASQRHPLMGEPSPKICSKLRQQAGKSFAASVHARTLPMFCMAHHKLGVGQSSRWQEDIPSMLMKKKKNSFTKKCCEQVVTLPARSKHSNKQFVAKPLRHRPPQQAREKVCVTNAVISNLQHGDQWNVHNSAWNSGELIQMNVP